VVVRVVQEDGDPRGAHVAPAGVLRHAKARAERKVAPHRTLKCALKPPTRTMG